LHPLFAMVLGEPTGRGGGEGVEAAGGEDAEGELKLQQGRGLASDGEPSRQQRAAAQQHRAGAEAVGHLIPEE
jgi:hypothetical protein